MAKVWLGLGSNLGDRERFILDAIALLGKAALRETRVSSLWESKARYVTDQPDFLNAAVSGQTDLTPAELLREVNRIEAALGRDRSAVVAKGPRSIDIDILLYGGRIIVEEGLLIPHPGIRERKFVLLPLLELDPELQDPVTGESFAALLAGLPPQGIYPYLRGGYDAPYP